MCWHEVSRCCYCCTVRSGVFLIAGLHITTLVILMAESIVQYGYPDDELLRVLFSKFRLQDNFRHIVMMAMVTATGFGFWPFTCSQSTAACFIHKCLSIEAYL